jgi:hypothetical protein
MHLRTLPRPLRAWGPEIRRRAAGPTSGTIWTSFWIQALLAGSGIMAARLLGVEDRGNLAFLALTTYILAHAGGLGLRTAATYFLAKQEYDAREVLSAVVRPAVGRMVSATPIAPSEERF